MITKIDRIGIIAVAVVVKRGNIGVKVKDDDAVEATAVVAAEVAVVTMTQGVEAHHHPLATVDRNHVKIEKERSTRNIIVQKRKRGGIIRIERRIRNAREVVGNTRHEIMRRMIVIVDDRMTSIIVVMMTRLHLTPPPLFLTMNVKYYNNMNPNVHHHPLLLVVQPHLANMA